MEKTHEILKQLVRATMKETDWFTDEREEYNHVRQLKNEATKLRREIEDIRTNSILSMTIEGKFQWPKIPDFTLPILTNGQNMPECSGIYFLINEAGSIQYVGQSVVLRNRVKLSHQKVMPGDRVTFVEIPVPMLVFAESFYIGICTPPRNLQSPCY